jgi:hypothetical protein
MCLSICGNSVRYRTKKKESSRIHAGHELLVSKKKKSEKERQGTAAVRDRS